MHIRCALLNLDKNKAYQIKTQILLFGNITHLGAQIAHAQIEADEDRVEDGQRSLRFRRFGYADLACRGWQLAWRDGLGGQRQISVQCGD